MSTEENWGAGVAGRRVVLGRLCAWNGRLAPHDRQQRCQFPQSRVIDVALEIDHLVEWQPVVDPAPAIELRLVAGVEADRGLAGCQPQREPLLLLANADTATRSAQITLRQAISQPAGRHAEDLHIAGIQAELFVELTKQRLLGSFATLDAALRKPIGRAHV